MERRQITAIFLSLAVLLAWSSYRRAIYGPPEGDVPAVEAGVDGELPDAVGDGVAEAPAPGPGTAPTPADPELPEAFRPPVESDIPVRDVVFESCGVQGTWDTGTGSVSNLHLPDVEGPIDVQPLWSFILEGAPGGFSNWKPYGDKPGPETLITPDGQLLTMGSGDLGSASPRTLVATETKDTLVLTGVTADGIEVKRTIRARPATADPETPCVLDVELSWTNVSGQPYSGDLWTGVHDKVHGSAGYYTNLSRPYAMFDGGVEWYSETEDLVEPESREGEIDWVGIGDRYYMAALVPASTEGQLYFSPRGEGDDTVHGAQLVYSQSLAPGASHSQTYQLYMGPKTWDKMAQVDEDLAYIVSWEYGWFAVLSFPMLWLLKFFYGLVGNWGLAIIVLTVSIKALLFPVTQSSFRSAQAMQALQPEMEKLREKFKDDPDGLNREMIALFQKHGVNPLGCLPMFLQMPIWIGLYRVLFSSVELYHTDFLYMKDLSVTDPFMVLPIVVMAMMVAQQQFTPVSASMDPTQRRMLQLMPIVFGFFFFAFPSGLVLYIFVNTLLTILQQWVIRRQFNAESDETAPAVATT